MVLVIYNGIGLDSLDSALKIIGEEMLFLSDSVKKNARNVSEQPPTQIVMSFDS